MYPDLNPSGSTSPPAVYPMVKVTDFILQASPNITWVLSQVLPEGHNTKTKKVL